MEDAINVNKVKKVQASDQVCNALQEQIASGKLKVGERLPSENDMAKAFGVSRLTVRLAIQKLNVMGILETKHGSGTYVTRFNFENYLTDASIFFEQSGIMEDVCAFRSALEPACAAQAIKRVTDKELEELKQLSIKYRELWMDRKLDREEWFKKAAEADLAFHEQICHMSHNSLFIYSFTMAKDSIYKYILFCLLNFNPPERWSLGMENRRDIHYDIYLALKNNDLEKCIRDLLKMINSHGEDAWSMPIINPEC